MRSELQANKRASGGAMMLLSAVLMGWLGCGDAGGGLMDPGGDPALATIGGAPATVTDLRIDRRIGPGANLAFTEVEDGQGQPASYDVRYTDTSPLVYESATRVSRGTCTFPLNGRVIGRRRACTVYGLDPDRDYAFQLAAVRIEASGVVAYGAPSNVAGAAGPEPEPEPDPEPEPEPVPAPAQVSDLASTSVGTNSATLRFTEVGDGTGGSASYQLRYAAGTLSWATATIASEGTCAAPLEGTAIGQVRTCTVAGLVPGTRYEFGMVAYRGEMGSDSVAVGELSNIAVATTPPVSAPAGLIFHSDFGTARGIATAALLDSGKDPSWTDVIGNGRANEVVSSTGLDFPSANVLRVMAEGSEGGSARAQSTRLMNAIPIPAIGQSVYYRWYFRFTVPDSFVGDNNTHPIQDAGPSNQNWLFRLSNSSNGTYNAQFRIGAASDWANSQFGTNLVLQKNVTYRFEMQIHRIGATTFNMHARVYGSNNALLYDDDDFRNANGSGSLANNPALPLANVDYLHGMTAGFNGLGAGTGYPIILYYQGAFCVRSDTWCGAYSNGT